MTTTVTKESLAARIAELESGPRSLKEDYTLAAYKMLLATMDSEPVAYMYRDNLHLDARFSLESKIGNWSPEDINEYEIRETPLYRHAQPATVVPDEVRRCLNFFASVIKSGEQWTSVCQHEYDTALVSMLNQK